MPDSQNKQGEQPHCWACNNRNVALVQTIPEVKYRCICCGQTFEWPSSIAISLLSQQHAPPKEVEELIEAIADRHNPYMLANRRKFIVAALTELATELTKGRDALREDMSGISDQHFREKLKLQEENSQLKQQLAEAKKHAAEYEEQECEEITSLQAKNIALSAVVEKMKRGLESIVHECGINPAGGYYIIAHAATQLLANLGHK